MENTVLEKAIDLQGKVRVLLQAASEVSNYLTIKSSDIQKIQSNIEDISGKTEALLKEKESVEKALKSVKKEFEQEKKALAEFKESSTKHIQEVRDQTAKEWQEARAASDSNKDKEKELAKKLDEVDNLKRQLEGKLSKIAEIGGK